VTNVNMYTVGSQDIVKVIKIVYKFFG